MTNSAVSSDQKPHAHTRKADLWSSFLSVAQAGQAQVTRRDRQGDDVTLTGIALAKHARSLALALKSTGVRQGDCVMLVMSDPLAFVTGFWACQAAGFTAVPMPPMGTDVQIKRTRAALGGLGRAWVLTDDESCRGPLETAQGTLGVFVLVGTNFDQLSNGSDHAVQDDTLLVLPSPDDIAVIMFSSGSTGAPKGVELSHHAIQAQIAMLHDALSPTQDDCFVNWMPMSHDYGLFHFHVFPLLCGATQVLLATEDFSRRPLSWLRALHDHGGTITGAPNLALQMVTGLLKPQRASQFNLSRLRCLSLGAEPLNPTVLREFAQRLEQAKLDPAVLHPAYGLAEATLVLSMRAGLDTVAVSRRSLGIGQGIQIANESNSDAVELTLLGKPVKDVEFRIVDGKEAALDVGTVGHLQARCTSLMQGYRNQPEKTAQALRDQGWLATGDIGFLHNGEFVMVGRAKDVIISGGSNHHPSDLEQAALGAPGLSKMHQVAIIQGRDPLGSEMQTVAFLRGRGSKEEAGALEKTVAAHLVAQTGVALDAVITVRDLPRTTSGKLQRHALVQAFEGGVYNDQLDTNRSIETPSTEPLRVAVEAGHLSVATQLICTKAGALCALSIDPDLGLMDQGISSRQAMVLCTQLGAALDRQVPISLLFDHPSPRALAQALIQTVAASAPADETGEVSDAKKSIAVIGYGCRFPGGDTPEEFWDFLNAPYSVVRPIPQDRWAQTPQTSALPPASLLSDIDGFDAGLFGMSAGEAAATNPVHRLLLQVLRQALEHAGLDIAALRGQRVGLFVGLSESGLATGRGEMVIDGDALAAYAVTGSAGSIAVGRMAHLFDFRGPAIAVDTACSSSIVALDMAAQSLRDGRCDLAIAGGANLILSPDLHAGLDRMGALSPDGVCKTFDANADGYGRGEGAGLVVLKGMAQAQRDRDVIRAELLASTLNHDGHSSSVTAPNGRAQRDLLRRALQEADLAGADLDWVETHGTGTALGDPVELAALGAVLRQDSTKPLALGAVKSRIGHLEAAAGIAGVIKILLALENGSVPTDRPRARLNGHFEWADTGLHPIDAPLDWPATQRRVAGVASFGMSGTNAYALLSDPPLEASHADTDDMQRPLVLPLSVQDKAAGAACFSMWRTALDTSAPSEHQGIVAGQAGRRTQAPWRAACVLSSDGAVSDTLETDWTKAMHAARLVFVYPGQGAQAAGMGADLYEHEPVFRAAFDAASDAAGLVDGKSLSDWLYGSTPADAAQINRTDLSQPVLVAFGYALTALWATLGVRPDAVMGHSVGEIGAALASGQFDLVTAMQLAVHRGNVMEACAPAGAMLALRGDEDCARTLIADLTDTVIAGYNGPASLSLAGPVDQIAQVEQRAAQAGQMTKPIQVTRAFHSPAMAQAASTLFNGVEHKADVGVLTVFSTLLGALAPDDVFASTEYWKEQMRRPVRFLQAAQAATQAGDTICLEIGPGAVVSRLGAACAPSAVWVSGVGDRTALAEATGKLWSHGAPVDWTAYFGTRGAAGEHIPRHPITNQPMPRRAIGAPVPQPVEASLPASPVVLTSDAQPSHAPREAMLETEILPIIARISGVPADQIAPDISLTGLGMDSLALVQLQRALASRLGLEVELRDLFETVETPAKLAALLARARPAPAPQAQGIPVPQTVGDGTDGIADVMRAQLKLVEDVIAGQLAALQGQTAHVGAGVASVASEKVTSTPKAEIKGLFRQPKQDASGLTPAQTAHVSELGQAWNTRSAGSKNGAQSARKHVANSRSVFGFSPDLKELTYPLMTDRAEGPHVWDVDGNCYVDVTMGFGVYLFGHRPDIVTQALHEELDRGAAIGPATPLAEQVAERIHALTGAERSAFFSTGTEAIMCAVRIARAVTGRQKIVIFRGAYHGSFDGILATGWIEEDGTAQSAPLTDGTLQGMVDDVITLDYGDMAGLEVIRSYADDIALVLVEPVQSRNPENRPLAFLKALRDLTLERDVTLLFDEVISGFRFAPGGMQEIFGIEADLVTYGKVLGHGQPIGVLAGKARYMDAVDGGSWAYGDDSAPSTRTAFVAGTFNGHPMALAAARAVLDRIQSEGDALFDQLAQRTAAMCARLDSLFEAEDVPVRMEWFGSLFRFNYGSGTEILNTHLLNNGVFVWEQRNCFLSTAHGEVEVDLIVDAARQGIAAMKSAGWFGASLPRLSQLPSGAGERALRRRAAQARSGTWTDLVILRLGEQSYPPDAVAKAWAQVCDHHIALRACLSADGARRVGAQAAAPISHGMLSLGDGGIDAALDDWAQRALDRTFAFDKAPLRLDLLEAGEQVLALTSSHLGFDGWSLAVVLRDLMRVLDGRPLEAVDGLDRYRAWEETTEYFRLETPPQPLALPVNGPDPAALAPRGQRKTVPDVTDLYGRISEVSATNNLTPLVGFMAPYVALLGWLSGQEQVTIGVPVAGQALSGCLNLVGNVSFVRPITVDISGEWTLSALARQLHSEIIKPGSRPPLDAMPVRHALFNLDGPIDLGSGTSGITLHPAPISGPRADLFLNLLRVGKQVVLDFDWNSDLIAERTAHDWLDAYLALVKGFAAQDMNGTQAFELIQEALPDQCRGTPLPNAIRAASRIDDAAPKRSLTKTEATLAGLWEELLGVSVQGPDADFQTLGGNSLQAVRLQGRITTHFGLEPDLEWVFALPRLADMASALDALGQRDVPDQTEAVLAGSQAPALPQQQQLHLLEDVSDAGPAYNICLRLDFQQALRPDTLASAMGQLARRHASLRTTFVWSEDGLDQLIATEPTSAIAPECLIQDDNSQAVLDDFARRPFTQDTGPLWRVGMMDQEEAGTTLVLVLHHIISDAWSAEIMVRDLLDAYQRVALDCEPLPFLKRDFTHHAVWTASADVARQDALAFWVKTATDMPELTAIPGEYPRPVAKSYEGARASRSLPADLLAALHAQAAQQRTSPFQMILAAIATYTATALKRRNVVIGTVSAGRSRPGMDKPIGFFANTLPLCLNLPQDQSWSERVADVGRTLLAATAHDLICLQEIVAALGLRPDPSANPLFEVCVTHDDRRGLAQLATELGFEFAEMPLPTTQFDLSFYVIETATELSLDVTYATQIYSAQRIEAILDAVFNALAAIAESAGLVADCPDVPAGTDASKRSPDLPDMTAVQKRLWFVDRFENGVLYDAAPTYYNMAGRYLVPSGLDKSDISARLATLYAQVPTLSAAFDMQADQPQFTAISAEPPSCAEMKEDAVDGFIDAPFDLSQGGLLRAAVVADAAGSRHLLLVAHHIVTDQRRLDQLARALLEDEMPPELQQVPCTPTALPEQIEADLAFWRATVGAEPARLLLPVDRPRAAVHVFERGLATVGLDTESLERLDAHAKHMGHSTDDLLLGAFVALLHRLSGQDAIVLGQTAPRAGAGLGPHDNLVTLNLSIDPEQGTEALMAEVSRLSAEAEQHSQTDFDAVVLDLKPENDMSRTAIFDVLMVRQGEVPAIRLSSAAIGWGKYDLVCAPMRNHEGGLDIGLTFNAQMFDAQTVAQWGAMLVHLLRVLPQEVEQPVGVLPLMPESDVAALLDAGAPLRDTSDIPFKSVPDAFGAIVRRRKRASAVWADDTHTSYEELAQDADELTQALLAKGVSKGDRVAILLPRGREYICAMIAVLQAGAVFVPLDVEAPRDRTALILEDAGVVCVLTSDQTTAEMPADTPCLNLDDVPPQDSMMLDLPQVCPEDAAYVIFTSGSTGRPKGVVVEHRNLLALVLGQGDLYPITHDDRWSWFHSAAFDFSIWEVWAGLLTGGEVVVIPDRARKDMGALREVLVNTAVTQLSLTPSAFQTLSDIEVAHAARSLAVRAIWFGGEALTPAILKPWALRYPECQLINLFGITETTVHATFCMLGETDFERKDSPVGRPLPTYGITVRDPALRPVPAGVQGEIIVSGSGVARGYLGRPAQTALRFMDDPHHHGDRIYRSGDLGRISASGELTYLGRADDQIKLRGFRIELGEIESAFRRFTGVRAAAAGLLGDDKAHQVLAVWTVLERPVDPDALTAHLAHVLPAYMIPRQIFVLDALPLTLNGKIDRAALRAATDNPLVTQDPSGTPRAGLESRIAEVLCGVLGRPRIGRRDSFFVLGGHSLMANKAVLRLRSRLGMTLSLRDFFAAQTVAALAALGCDETVVDARSIHPVPDADSYPLSSAQMRLFAVQTTQPDSAAYNMVGGFVIDGELDIAALASAFADLRNRHEILRTRFEIRSGAALQIVDPPQAQFEFIEVETGVGPLEDRVKTALDPEFAHVFDLAKGPLIRAGVAPLGMDRWLLVLNVHHIISDGWSVPIMMSDLSAFYAVHVGDKSAELPPPMVIQYRDFASWQKTAPAVDVLDASGPHWQERFGTGTLVTSLQTDRARPVLRAGQGRMARYLLSSETSAALRDQLNASGATLFSACATALHILLRLRGSGEGATVIGTAYAARDAIETEDQLGFYLNLLPHVLDLDVASPLKAWLQASAEETGAMLDHKTAPFEQMLDHLGLKGVDGHNPGFDILLLVQSNEATGQKLGPLGLTALPDQTRTARYDLNLMVEDRAAIELVLEYDSTLFEGDTIDALLADFARLLEGMCHALDQTPLAVLELSDVGQGDPAQGLLDADDPLFGAL